MKLWKLPSWVDPRKALKTLISAAAEGGVAPAVKARAYELENQALERVELPGFHLFEGPCPVSPYTWLLPTPKGDEQDLLNLWEAYVNQDLGARAARRSPLTPIESDRFVLNRAAFQRVFGPARKPSEWSVPAAMIIALAQHMEGQENLNAQFAAGPIYERRRLVSIRMHISDYLMEVTPRGAYSNLQGKLIETSYQAGDARLDGLCIRPLRTDHPLAYALMENEDTPHACLQAANVVLRAVQLGLLRESDIKLSGGPSPRTQREQAVVEAISTLDRDRDLRRMYDLLVPRVVTAAEFRRDFGNPFRGTRAPRRDTVEKWRTTLYSLVT